MKAFAFRYVEDLNKLEICSYNGLKASISLSKKQKNTYFTEVERHTREDLKTAIELGYREDSPIVWVKPKKRKYLRKIMKMVGQENHNRSWLISDRSEKL